MNLENIGLSSENLEKNRIRQLDLITSNQIAAGEVIERPRSALQELIENSIDAGANSIDIIYANGGKSFLSVKDNGHGINKTDLLLALSRHATSKIDTITDLTSIKSLGFRGEALASIGSVSELIIKLFQKNFPTDYFSIVREIKNQNRQTRFIYIRFVFKTK